jgi:Probable sensor domain DACNV
MNTFIYPTDAKIIDGLVKCIDYFHASGPAFFPSPPSGEQLKELLDCCFAASLTTEEERDVTFTVTFFADREQAFPYRMNQLFPISPQDLAHLAVALDPSRTRICVVPGETSLQIAGLIHLGEQEYFWSGMACVCCLLTDEGSLPSMLASRLNWMNTR